MTSRRNTRARTRTWALGQHPSAALAAVLILVTSPDARSQELSSAGDAVVLTGALSAAEAERMSAPVTSNWQLTLQWLIPEGERVEPGDRVALFDPAGVEDRYLQAEDQLIVKEQERASQAAQALLRRLDLELAVARADIAHRKAAIDAAVPQDILEGKNWRERQRELAKTRSAKTNADLALVVHDTSTRAALAKLDIDIEGSLRSLEKHARDLDSLELRATTAGLVVYEKHPWFGRTVRQGDRIQATFPVARIPNLDTLEVEAWAGEGEAARLAPGQRALLWLDAHPQRRFTGIVRTVATIGERRESWGRAPFFLVRVTIDAADRDLMKPGMSVRCEVRADASGGAS